MAWLESYCKKNAKKIIIRPILFKRFIEDGFGITKGSKKDFEYWVSEFNFLRKSITIDKFSYDDSVEFMDRVIFTGESF